MATDYELREQTREFFKHYWHPDNGKAPEWSAHWDFNSPIPNNEKRGCYALFQDKEVIYIGLGIGKGAGMYEECGLGYRLKRYWKVNKNNDAKTKYQPSSHWTEVTSIVTIGFEKQHYQIAAALEIYLINILNPKRNSHHRKP